MSIAAYTYTFNCIKGKFPFRESVLSALNFADAFYWCDCESDDGTFEVACEMANRDERIKLMVRPWGDHYSVQPKICNEILDAIGKQFDYAMLVQADEVACEWTVDDFLRQLNNRPIQIGRPYYRNFVGDYRTTFPFIYNRKGVLCRTDLGLRWSDGHGGDACSLVGATARDLALEFNHYTKVHQGRRREALAKEIAFQGMYKDLGFPDPKLQTFDAESGIDYRQFCEGPFTEYAGPHPAVMEELIKESENAR